MQWTIEAKVLPLVAGISGHLYLEVFDPAGKRHCQINGLATNPKTSQPRSIGIEGDLLKVYTGFVLAASGQNSSRDNHPHKGHVLFSGTKEDIDRALEAIHARATAINKQDVAYFLLGTNSNSAFVSLVEALGQAVPVDQAAYAQMLKIKKILPGIHSPINLGDAFNGAASNDNPSKAASARKKKNPPKPGA